MTVLTRNPTNPNLLHANKFQLNFARNPELQYFCQSIMIPGISLSEIPKPNPFVNLFSPGEKATYDILNVTFMVDEELKAWIGIHDWIRAMTFPTNYEEYVNLPNIGKPYFNQNQPQFSDAALTILSSANTPLYRFKFVDLFPISISTFPMSTTESPDVIVTADASFRYSWYDIEKLF